MPTPAYIDLTLYLPLGGINGYELNGHAVNGAAFIDSPFAASTFTLDPYRSIVEGEPQATDLRAILASLLPDEPDLSVQRPGDSPSEVWAARCEIDVGAERIETSLTAEVVSLTDVVSNVSLVPPEYRTAYVLATHSSTTAGDRKDSDLDTIPPSTEQDTTDVSIVPPEYRTVKVPRGDS